MHKLVLYLMGSDDAAKKRDAQKKAAVAPRRGGKGGAATSKATASKPTETMGVDNLTNGAGDLHISDRTCTGVLCSHPQSRDIRATAEDESGTHLWDLRMLKFPVLELPGHAYWTWTVKCQVQSRI